MMKLIRATHEAARLLARLERGEEIEVEDAIDVTAEILSRMTAEQRAEAIRRADRLSEAVERAFADLRRGRLW